MVIVMILDTVAFALMVATLTVNAVKRMLVVISYLQGRSGIIS